MRPYLHAVGAAGYIGGIVLVLQSFVDNEVVEGTLLLPMAMLGLLTLSATVMAFLFGYKPLTLYLDGQKQEALRFFIKTVAAFALIVLVYVVCLVVIAT